MEPAFCTRIDVVQSHGATLMFLCQVSSSLYTSLKCSGVGRQEDVFLTEYFVAVERNSF